MSLLEIQTNIGKQITYKYVQSLLWKRSNVNRCTININRETTFLIGSCNFYNSNQKAILAPSNVKLWQFGLGLCREERIKYPWLRKMRKCLLKKCLIKQTLIITLLQRRGGLYCFTVVCLSVRLSGYLSVRNKFMSNFSQ